MTVVFMDKGKERIVFNVDRVEDSDSNYTIRLQFSDTPIVVPITRTLTIKR